MANRAHTYGMGDAKEKIKNMTDILVDVSSALSLLSSVNLYWKYQLLLENSKDLHTCMVLDDMLQEEDYLVQGGIVYHHGRVFLSRASKLK